MSCGSTFRGLPSSLSVDNIFLKDDTLYAVIDHALIAFNLKSETLMVVMGHFKIGDLTIGSNMKVMGFTIMCGYVLVSIDETQWILYDLTDMKLVFDFMGSTSRGEIRPICEIINQQKVLTDLITTEVDGKQYLYNIKSRQKYVLPAECDTVYYSLKTKLHVYHRLDSLGSTVPDAYTLSKGMTTKKLNYQALYLGTYGDFVWLAITNPASTTIRVESLGDPGLEWSLKGHFIKHKLNIESVLIETSESLYIFKPTFEQAEIPKKAKTQLYLISDGYCVSSPSEVEVYSGLGDLKSSYTVEDAASMVSCNFLNGTHLFCVYELPTGGRDLVSYDVKRG